jgi:serine/threonine protein kinase
LGEGAFGRVYRGVDAESGARFAVKRLRDDIVDGRADAAVLAAMHRAAAQEVKGLSAFRAACKCSPRRSRLSPQVKVLSEFRHPHIVLLLGVVDHADEAELWAVLELAPHGSLLDAMRAVWSPGRSC